MLFCTNEDCGTKNRDEATFCINCGQPLQQSLRITPQVGDYRVLDLIGHGANGAVYTAEHRQKPGMILALKAVFKRADIASLKTEFTVLEALRHPNLPRYYAWFEHQGYGYLVMEFVPGQNLAQLLAQRRGPLSPTLVINYALQLCDVLTFLHTQPQRILHRDLKPANIRLTHTDVVKLVDFGLLKQGTEATRNTQRGHGTLAYMPIEQFGSGTDQRSDLYSLGATLYHLLTGHEPLPVVDRLATGTDTLPPPHHLHPALSPHVGAVVVRAMGCFQHERYEDVARFKAALQYAETQPFQPGSGAPLPGGSSAGAVTQRMVPPASAPDTLPNLWQQARKAYVLGQWGQAEALLVQVAVLDPQNQEVQTRLAEAHRQVEQERRYATLTSLRAADRWQEVLATFKSFPPNVSDPQGHRLWAAARQRREQHYEAALDAALSATWRTALDHLTALLAEAPGDADATALLAHAQAMQAEAERLQREAAERLQRGAVERQRREAAERQQREATERQQREAAERQQREAAERQQREVAERQQREAAERQQREAAERQQREAVKIRQHWMPEMVEVPAGSFLMGSNESRDERPRHTLSLPTYWISKTPVTNTQFRPFVEGDGYINGAYWDDAGWQWRTYAKRMQPEYWNETNFNGATQPVVNVTWYEAMAYTRWLSAKTGMNFSLPTEAEWEYAARGPNGLIYPWGNAWDAKRANSSESGLNRTTPVGTYPNGASPFGVLDMAGNVWEWTRSISSPYPYNATDGRENLSDPIGKRFTLRGGSSRGDSLSLRAASRSYRTSTIVNRNVGVRLVRYLSDVRPTATPVVLPTTVSPSVTPIPIATPIAVPAALVPTMVAVPAGSFVMGSSDHDKAADGDERPHHLLTLPRYWIGKTPVTNAQFRQFVDGDGYRNQAYWTRAGWQWRDQEKIVKPFYWNDARWNGADYPVVGVSWFEAVAYCYWLSKQTGITFRLPSEAEWEKAARGTYGWIYPWGNTWEKGCCNSKEAGIECTTPVGKYPTGASPYGALDMAGNVWEWCATKWGKPYPYQLEDEWQAAYLAAVAQYRVLRGGSWYVESTRGAYRGNSNPRDRLNRLGLRVASHAPVSGS